MNKPLLWQVVIILTVGVFAVSASAVLIRLSMEAAGMSGVGFSLFLAASRLTLAALTLLPAWRIKQSKIKGLYWAGAAGLCLALHFATWITSLSFTSIAASTTLVTTNPVWVALFSWLWFNEKPSRLTGLGIAIALFGGILIALGDQSAAPNSHPLLGNLLALVGAIMASLYLLFGRESQRQGLGLSAYIVVAYSTAALVLLPLPMLFGASYRGYPTSVYGYVVLMAVLSQLIGHTSFNWAVRWVSPTLVTLVILCEPVGSSFLGYLIFGEVPSSFVLLGAGVLLAGVAMAVVGGHQER